MSDYRNNQQTMREPVEQPTERGEKTGFQPKMGTVANTPFVKVRKAPNAEAPTVTNKRKGERVRLLGIEGDFYKIVAYGEAEGYIMRRYIEED